MIFLTVGHQMPFDRLVRAVDDWLEHHADCEVFGQIGQSDYQPHRFKFVAHLSPEQFDRCLDESTAVVAHAGTGTIIAALERSKPLLVMPRLSALGETRNDHQIATAGHFAKRGWLLVAESETDLPQRLGELQSFQPAARLDGRASPELLRRLRGFCGLD